MGLHPEQLIGRAKELTVVEQRLSQIRRGEPPAEWVISIVGTVGMGKTALLRELKARGAAEPGAEAVAVDLGGSPDLLAAQRSFLDQCLSATRPGSPLQQIAALLAGAGPQPDEHALTEPIARIFERATPADPALLLLLDSCERAPEGLIAWVERVVLQPLLHTRRTLVVAAGRAPLRWHRYETRQRTLHHHLSALSREEVDALSGGPELGQVIAGLSFGHPLAASVALGRLAGQAAPWAATQQAAAAAAVVAAIFGRIDPPLTPAQQELVQVLALLRAYEPRILEQIAPRLAPTLRGYNKLHFIQALRPIPHTGLVDWNEPANTWVINPTIRSILCRAAELADPAAYAEARALVERLYADEPPR